MLQQHVVTVCERNGGHLINQEDTQVKETYSRRKNLSEKEPSSYEPTRLSHTVPHTFPTAERLTLNTCLGEKALVIPVSLLQRTSQQAS